MPAGAKKLRYFASSKDSTTKLRTDTINNAIKTRRYVHFDLTTDITKGKEKLHLAIAENENVYIENKAIYINNCPLIVNNSKIYFNADAHKNKKYNLEVYSTNFDVKNIVNLINSQIIDIVKKPTKD